MLNGMGDDDDGDGGITGVGVGPLALLILLVDRIHDPPTDYLDIAVGQRRIMEMEGTHSITQWAEHVKNVKLGNVFTMTVFFLNQILNSSFLKEQNKDILWLTELLLYWLNLGGESVPCPAQDRDNLSSFTFLLLVLYVQDC